MRPFQRLSFPPRTQPTALCRKIPSPFAFCCSIAGSQRLTWGDTVLKPYSVCTNAGNIQHCKIATVSNHAGRCNCHVHCLRPQCLAVTVSESIPVACATRCIVSSSCCLLKAYPAPLACTILTSSLLLEPASQQGLSGALACGGKAKQAH